MYFFYIIFWILSFLIQPIFVKVTNLFQVCTFESIIQRVTKKTKCFKKNKYIIVEVKFAKLCQFKKEQIIFYFFLILCCATYLSINVQLLQFQTVSIEFLTCSVEIFPFRQIVYGIAFCGFWQPLLCCISYGHLIVHFVLLMGGIIFGNCEKIKCPTIKQNIISVVDRNESLPIV